MSRARSFVQLGVAAALAAAVLVISCQHVAALDAWAGRASLPWVGVSLAGYVLAALIAWRSYPQLKNPRLYALAFLLLPLGAIHALRYANPPGEAGPLAASAHKGSSVGPDDLRPSASVNGGNKAEARPAGASPDAQARFPGLPDGLVKRYPRLPGQLHELTQRAHAFSFLLLALAIALATLCGTRSRRALQRMTLGLLLGELVVLGAILALGPASPADWPAPLTCTLAPTLGAAAAAFVLWHSPAGLGGGVAGLLLFVLPVTLAEAGVAPTDLGLSLKGLPPGPARVLVSALPWLFVALVVREWAVGLTHTTERDELTQIYNKAYAEGIVNQTVDTRLGSCFSVALLDIDHFKKVNDTHGHGAGDDVLHRVAQTIQGTVGSRGLVCRTGGEEITVFFPTLGIADAADACEEVRLAVAALEVPTRNNDGKAVTLRVTVSIGVASNRSERGDRLHAKVREVVAAADRGVYAAKQGGRDRVVRDEAGSE